MTLRELKTAVSAEDSRSELRDAIEQKFLGHLPTDQLRDVFSDPPAGSSGEAVLTAVRSAVSDTLTMVAAAFLSSEEEIEKQAEVKVLGEDLQDPDGFDQDFREPVVR